MNIYQQLCSYINANSITRGHPAEYEKYIHGEFGEAPRLSAETRDVNDLVSIVGWITLKRGVQRLLYATLSSNFSHAIELQFTAGTQTILHTHNYIELAYIARGRLIQKIKGKTVTFTQGEICLVDRETLHCDILLHEDATVLCLGVDSAFFSRFLQTGEVAFENARYLRQLITRKRTEYSFVRFSPIENAPKTKRTFELLLEELLHTLPGKTKIVKGYTERLIDLLALEYRFELNKTEKHELGKAVLRDVIDYVEHNYQTATVQQLAALFRYNPDYLSRQCFKKTGMNLSQFIQKVRVEKALELLETTQLSIEDIAREVGYSNLGFFYQKFKAQYHITPNQARAESS